MLKSVLISELAITHTRKSFCSEISSTFSFYARELNFMTKCRKMNKIYYEIIKSSGKYGKKKKNITKLPIHKKVYTKPCIFRYSSNTVKSSKLKHFLSKSRENFHSKHL